MNPNLLGAIALLLSLLGIAAGIANRMTLAWLLIAAGIALIVAAKALGRDR